MELEQQIEVAPARVEPAKRRRIKVIRAASISPAVLLDSLAELYRSRDLLLTLTIHRIRVRYKQSALGLSWALLQPISLMLVYTVIFSVVAHMKSDGLPYSLFVFGGLLPWIMFQTAVSSSSSGLVTHSTLITKVYFPREILPITYVLAALFDFIISCLVLAAMMIFYHVAPRQEILFAIPILLVELIFATGLALFLSAAQVRFRDIGIAMPLIMQLMMFGTPVVYPLAQVPERFRWFYLWNPMAGIVENFRRVVVLGLHPDLHLLVLSASLSVATLLFGYIFFKHREATMADII
ncbi:MAG TPA: ABC transporter permease [Bryobacteraceae bacterium]|jgi:lipopolysaccharide transport system permease protein|nr:ABC transporter permease [Bryobacteraceae bacterium]